MRPLRIASLLAALALVGCSKPAAERSAASGPAIAETAPVSALELREPWVRPTPPGATAGAAYFTVVSPAPDRLVGVAVPTSVAARAELHAVVADSTGAMGMHSVEGIDVPAQTPVALKPGSFHVMLFDLVKPLAPGDSVTVTLRFEQAGERVLVAPVREP